MPESFRDQGVQLLHEARKIGATIHILRNWKPIDDLVHGEKRLASPRDAYVVLRHAAFCELKIRMTLEGKFMISGRMGYVLASASGVPSEAPRVIGAKELCKRFSLRTMRQALSQIETIVAEHVYGMHQALQQAAELNGVEPTAEAA